MRWPVLLCVLLLACPPPAEPTVGSSCTPENIGRCDTEDSRLLQCTGGVFQVYADCRGSQGCTLSGDTAVCDTTGNSVGDRCAPTSEGKVRCDPDGGLNILRCSAGGLEVIFECQPPTVCGISDAGLTCI